jgi:hypothetical protein
MPALPSDVFELLSTLAVLRQGQSTTLRALNRAARAVNAI